MENPYRIPGDNGMSYVEKMSDLRFAIKIIVPCVTLIILGFTTCVAVPQIIEANKKDPYFEEYCKDTLIRLNGHDKKCPNSGHTSIFINNKDGKLVYMACKCDRQPLIQKTVEDSSVE